MKTRNVHIWYDRQGNILAVGHVPERNDSGDQQRKHRVQVVPKLLEGQFHLQADVPEEAVATLNKTHLVDIKTGFLATRRDVSVT